MRYALIAVAIGASVLCVFVAWRLWLGEQVVVPESASEPDYTFVVVLAVAAVVLAFAAGGLMARRVEGAYLLSVAAFMLTLALCFLAMVALMTLAYGDDDAGILPLLCLGLPALDLWVAVQGIRLGRRIANEQVPHLGEARRASQ